MPLSTDRFRRRLTALLGAACLAVALPGAAAQAAAPVAVALSAADQADLKRVETYLDGVHTLKGGFTQTNADGTVAQGKIFLSRPGHMRFEYDPPVHMLIVSNGDYVAVDDIDLKHISYFPVEKTPVWFLLREGIKLSGDVTVTRFDRGPDVFRITAVQSGDPKSGSITLVFSDWPLSLQKWIILDAQGRTTTVALVNPQTGVTLDDDMFRLPKAPSKS